MNANPYLHPQDPMRPRNYGGQSTSPSFTPSRSHAFASCKTPRRVTKAELINALHQSHCQLVAAQYGQLPGCLDHKPAIAEINRVMSKAGHIGFTP